MSSSGYVSALRFFGRSENGVRKRDLTGSGNSGYLMPRRFAPLQEENNTLGEWQGRKKTYETLFNKIGKN